ncbi:hypothetical protein [Actinocrispum wychmicini]|uniref:Uncharacterized protein n=1 Tax=Actinocrispum wychmicini TaxID=1213861 RepID=A0A4R2K442_9PSEU|nr:hypothetical protein [Actinocrispum wychmicini]TCO64576.1 hypothetical protein EV192_101353 [Actinocrispum wychmicini]
MAWQDDLSRLDEELSAGRIHSDEYRRRRDELLAAASSNPAVTRARRQPSVVPGPTSDDADVTQQVEMPDPRQQPNAWVAVPAQPVIEQPPINSLVPKSAPMHGAEVFGLTNFGPARRRTWPRFVIAIVVLALIGAGIWLFVLRKDGPADSAPPAAPQFTLDRLPNPTDSPLSTSGVLTVDQAQIYNLIKPDEAQYLLAGGTQKIFYRQVVSGTMSTQIFYFMVAPGGSGTPLAKRIVDRGTKLGMATVPGLPAGVTGLKSLAANAGIFEAAYPTDQGAVRIVIGQTGEPAEKTLTDKLKQTVTAVSSSLPYR